MFRGKHWKYITFAIPIEKKLQELIETMGETLKKKNKMGETLQKIYLIFYNLLIAQVLWQAHYQILSTIFLKKFIELNVNTDMMIKNVRFVELNISNTIFFSNIETLKMI